MGRCDQPRAGANGGRRRIKVSAPTKAEVRRKLADLRKRVDNGLEEPAGRLTPGAYLDRWTAGLDGRVKPGTADSYRTLVRLHIKPALGHRPLAKLRVDEVDALWTSKLAEGKSANTVRIMRATLRPALRDGGRYATPSAKGSSCAMSPPCPNPPGKTRPRAAR